MKVLIIQIRQLGDVLLSSPLAKALKENLKNCEVHFLTSQVGSEILKGNPYIDRIIPLKEGSLGELRTLPHIRKEKYDAVIDVQRTGRSQRLTFFSGAPLRIAFRKPYKNWPYNRTVEWENRDYTVWERLKLLEALNIKLNNLQNYMPEFFNFLKTDLPFSNPYITLIPTSRRENRIWNYKKLSRIVEFIYNNYKLPAVILYGPGEKDKILSLKSLIKTPVFIPQKALRIGESAFIIKKSKLFIGFESFGSHLSIACRTKTLVITKKHTGWFPEKEWIREVYSENTFPEVEKVEKVIEELINEKL